MDQRLTWKDHIDKLVDQCTRRLNLMRIISSREWGADLSTLRCFYLAFIRSKIAYAAEIWSSCAKTQMQRLCRLQNAALRLMTGALRTTPVAAMEIEADVLPLDLFIDAMVLRKRVSAHFMAPDAPGRVCKCSAPLSFYQRSKRLLKDRKIKLPDRASPSFVVQALFSGTPPWEWDPPESHQSIPTDLPKSQAPESLLQQLSLALINEDYKDCTDVYTDGSLNPTSNSAGAGIFIPSEDIEVIIPLPPCSILVAEIIAIERALQEISHLPSASSSESHFVILTDSKASLQTLNSYKPTDTYHLCQSIRTLCDNIPAKITFQWIPSHVGIPGNERVDHLAKLAAESGPVNQIVESVSSLFCRVRQSTHNVWCERWKDGQTGRLYFEVQQKPNPVRYKGIPRQDQVALSRLRMQHFPTQSFLHRFNLADDPTCLLCGQAEETIHHLVFDCSSLSAQRSYAATCQWSQILKNTNNEWSSIFAIVSERRRRMHARALLPDACSNK